MLDQFEFAAEGRDWIQLAWAAVLAILLCWWSIRRRAQLLEVFGYDRGRSGEWLASLRRRRWRRASALAAAVLFLAVAAAQPRANPERTTYRTRARDIVVLLDVSRSMLADDLKPNRLERAKLELGRLSRELKGDRIGLIVFAGDAVIKCPLTANYSYFRSVLGTVDSRSASVGGTRIGDAIRKALSDLLGLERPDDRPEADKGEGVQPGETVLEEELRGKKPGHADILLITDGEDHDSYPEKAAEKAARLNVGIFAVGIGSEQGARIPIPSKKGGTEFLRHEGQEVYSKLNSRTLENMVNAAPRGRYLPAGTYNFDLVDLYLGTIALEEGQDVVDEQVAWTEIFQPFLITGLCLYLLYLFIPERPRRGQLMAVESSSAGRSGRAGDDVRAAAVTEVKT